MSKPQTRTIYVHGWRAPTWYALENKNMFPAKDDTYPPVEAVLEDLVSRMSIRSFHGEPLRPIFPDHVYRTCFLLGLCRVLPFEQKVEFEGETQTIDNPFRLAPSLCLFHKIEVASEPYVGSNDDDALFREKMTQWTHLVEKQKGGLEGKGMSEDEFEEYWEDFVHCFMYNLDRERPLRIIDALFDTKERRERILKFYDVKVHFLLISDFLDAANKTFFELAMRDANSIVLAAFVHNLFFYVHPRLYDNDVTARLAANLILTTNGLVPLVPMDEEYYEAVRGDAEITVRTDIVEETEISVFEVLKYIVKLNEGQHCQECATPKSTKLCGGCRNVRYCSIECQTKNRPKHKDFCTNKENKSAFAYFVSRRTQQLLEAKQILKEKAGLKVKVMVFFDEEEAEEEEERNSK